MEYTYLIVLLLPGRRWIGPRELLSRDCFSKSGYELKIHLQVTGYSQQLIPVSFVKHTDLNICEIGSKPIFMTAYQLDALTSARMIERLEGELARNRHWVRYECEGQYLGNVHKTTALR